MWMIKTETPEGKCVNIRKTLQTKPLVGTYLWKQINKYVHIKTQAHLWLLHCPMNCCKYFSLLCPRNHSLQDFYIYHCDKLRTSLQLLQENKRRTSVYTILYSMKNERSFILPYYENSQNKIYGQRQNCQVWLNPSPFFEAHHRITSWSHTHFVRCEDDRCTQRARRPKISWGSQHTGRWAGLGLWNTSVWPWAKNDVCVSKRINNNNKDATKNHMWPQSQTAPCGSRQEVSADCSLTQTTARPRASASSRAS